MRAATIDQANRRRLIRALEVVETLSTHPPTELLDCTLRGALVRYRTYKRRPTSALSSTGCSVAQTVHLATEVQATTCTDGVTRERLDEIGFEYRLMLDYIDGKLTDEAFISPSN
jgi:tRNA A37 N6-isopentenylltransferase MiaA